MTEVDLDEFFLDPRLASDPEAICDLALCHVRLVNDARYPWLLLVPKRAGVSELFDLSQGDRATLVEETSFSARVLKDVTHCHTINIGKLGNIVAQLHVHVTARFVGDPAWPLVAWPRVQAHRYDEAARDTLINVLRNRLSSEPSNR